MSDSTTHVRTTAPPTRRWSLVVPVKVLRAAKSRLEPLPRDRRAAVALAFASDTVAAALACALVDRVVVVTDDDEVAARVRGLGATVVPDGPRAGLNAALRHGVGLLQGDQLAVGDAVAALTADLPAVQPADLYEALTAAALYRTAFVADADGMGTTLLAARAVSSFRPSFGPGSAAAHRRSGAVEVGVHLERLRRDVDTVEDLRRALVLGVGAHTRGVAGAIAGVD